MKNTPLQIKQELEEWGIPLEHKPTMPFVLPEGYFSTFQSEMLAQINTLDYVTSLPQEMPQRVPNNYFETLQKRVLDEIEVLDLTDNLPKAMPMEAPNHYFEKMQSAVLAKIAENNAATPAPLTVHSAPKRKTWALAASMALIVSLGLFFVNTDPSKSMDIEKQLAQLPVEQINNYIDDHDYDFKAFDIVENPQFISKEMKSLEDEILEATKTLSDEEIFEYVL